MLWSRQPSRDALSRVCVKTSALVQFRLRKVTEKALQKAQSNLEEAMGYLTGSCKGTCHRPLSLQRMKEHVPVRKGCSRGLQAGVLQSQKV